MKKITGGCHCGNIRFEAELADDSKVVICHCNDCQRFSGAPYRASIPVSGEHLIITGALKDYVKTTADSGTARIQAFCPECGSQIYSTAVAGKPEDKICNVRLGAVDQCRDFSPTVEIWCESAQPWVPPLTGTQKVPRQP